MKQNIGRNGRIVRAAFGVSFLLAGALVFPHVAWLAIAFVVAGLFTLFEAARGWCGLRACGLKTPF